MCNVWTQCNTPGGGDPAYVWYHRPDNKWTRLRVNGSTLTSILRKPTEMGMNNSLKCWVVIIKASVWHAMLCIYCVAIYMVAYSPVCFHKDTWVIIVIFVITIVIQYYRYWCRHNTRTSLWVERQHSGHMPRCTLSYKLAKAVRKIASHPHNIIVIYKCGALSLVR